MMRTQMPGPPLDFPVRNTPSPRVLVYLLSMVVLLCACSPISTPQKQAAPPVPDTPELSVVGISLTATFPATITPTLTPTPTPPPTLTVLPPTPSAQPPSPTPSPSPSPTPLPVLISVLNASAIQETSRYGAPLIYGAVQSPDGSLIYANTGDGMKVYDHQYQKVRSYDGVYPHPETGMRGVSLSSDGQRMAIAERDGVVRVYDLEQGVIFEKPGPDTIYAGRLWTAISPGGGYAAYPIRAEDKWIGRWQVAEIETGAVLAEWHGWNGRFSQNGQIYAVEVGTQLYFWNTLTWEKIAPISFRAQEYGGVWEFSPVDSYFVTAEGTGLNIWNIPTHSRIRHIEYGEFDYTPSVRFSPDGAQIIVSGWKDRNKVDLQWEIDTGQPAQEAAQPEDNSEIEARLFRVEAGDGYVGPRNTWYFRGFEYNESDILSVVASYEDYQFIDYQVCDIFQGKCAITRSLDLAITGETILTASMGEGDYLNFSVGLPGSETPVGRAYIGKQFINLLGTASGYLAYSTYPLGGEETVNLQNILNGQVYRELTRGDDGSSTAVFSRDGTRLAVISQHYKSTSGVALIVFDLSNNGTVLYRLKVGEKEFVTGGAFDVSGSFAYSYSAGGGAAKYESLVIFDPYHRRIVAEYKGKYGEPTAFSPDGTILVCVKNVGFDGEISLIDPTSGSVIHRWNAHNNTIISARFSPDGRSIATIGTDGYIKLWGIK